MLLDLKLSNTFNYVLEINGLSLYIIIYAMSVFLSVPGWFVLALH